MERSIVLFSDDIADICCTAASHCPLYCRFCTRSYAVGGNTAIVTKCSLKATRRAWEDRLQYIAHNPVINDVVISGGDSYSLHPVHLRDIGNRLLAIPHIRRFRIATKGLCVSPSRTLDPEDGWTDELIALTKRGKECGKSIALHTHFNHPNEFSWVSREAAQKLYVNGVTVRNQAVLLKGVNDTVETMGALIRELADNNIIPVCSPISLLLRPLFSINPHISITSHLSITLFLINNHSTTSTKATWSVASRTCVRLSPPSYISNNNSAARSRAS